MVEPLPLTTARIEQCREMDLVTHAVQLSVWMRGEAVAEIASGDARPGRPVSKESIFRQYCTMKPATTIALAQLVSGGEVALDQPVSHFLPRFAQNHKERITLRHLLTHTSGIALLGPTKLASAEEFLDDVCRTPLGSVPGTQAAYWTSGAWLVLGAVIETVVGGPLSPHLRDQVFLPLGMEDSFVGMTGEQWAGVEDRLGVSYVDARGMDVAVAAAGAAAGGVTLPPLTDDGFFPIEWEATEEACASRFPEGSGYAPTSNLARFYDALLRPDELAQRDIIDAEVLRVFTSAQRRGMYDVVLLRVCDFGLGFMVDVREHHFGERCSKASFGHSGIAGSSLAFADPRHGLAVALVFNDLLDWETAFLRRKGVINAVYKDLGLQRTDEETR